MFTGPDGDGFAMIEAPDDARQGWDSGCVTPERAIRGFHSVGLRLADAAATAEVLRLMGYADMGRDGTMLRFRRAGGNGADLVEIEEAPDMPDARQGGGSVHHVAFSVPDRAAQDEVRAVLDAAGLSVTQPLDRSYFWSVYFRTPGGVLFEVATDGPGFATDEDAAHLGETLQLPPQHEHLRDRLEESLAPIG
jgi:glyoxalase family protein